MKSLHIAALLSVLVMPVAYAHGDDHQSERTYDAATAEQKDFGIAGDPKKATRTIRVTMFDTMRFAPSQITVQQGETVTLLITNRGKLRHELVMGSADDLQTHAALMKQYPTMEHDEPFMAHVKPGRAERLVWTFNRPGIVEFACLINGHYEAGMAGRISVRPAKQRATS